MKNNKQAQVFHFDVFGKRQDKYDFLENHSIDNINWNELQPEKPGYFLVSKDFGGSSEYEKGFKIDEIFKLNASGIKTQRDDASIKFTKAECDEIKNDFLNLLDIDLKNKYGFKDVRDWKIDYAKADLKKNPIITNSLLYRPFDIRYMNYTGKTKGIMGYPRYETMKHLVKENIALLSCRQQSSFDFQHIFITKNISDMCSVSLQTKETGYIFPLYLYPETNAQQTIGQSTTPVFDHPSKGEFRTPNLNMEIVKQLAEKLSLTFVPEKEPEGKVCYINNPEVRPVFKTTFAPIDILDYIYAVLHSPTYREKYKEFLKIDFPRVPYPKDAESFWQLVELGSEIRQIHLLESPKVNQFITSYPVDGDNTVVKPQFINSAPVEQHGPPRLSGTPPEEGNWVADSPPSEGWSETGVVETPLEGCPQDGVVETHDKIIFIKKTKIKLNPILELPYNPNLKQRARELRQAGNLPEVLFWMQVTKGGFYNIDFDRQRVIGNYIVDFYVKKLGLVVEIDGESHIGKEDYDRERENFLISLGLRVYRIKVEDVMQRLPEVMNALENYIIEQYGIEPPRLSGTPPKEGNLAPNSPPLEGWSKTGVVDTPLEGWSKTGVVDTPLERWSETGVVESPSEAWSETDIVGRVYINETQYFDGVPEIAWNFYIGGYQPAQKWLKDRKSRTLNFEDIIHYQKIIVALIETHRLMQKVDIIGVE